MKTPLGNCREVLRRCGAWEQGTSLPSSLVCSPSKTPGTSNYKSNATSYVFVDLLCLISQGCFPSARFLKVATGRVFVKRNNIPRRSKAQVLGLEHLPRAFGASCFPTGRQGLTGTVHKKFMERRSHSRRVGGDLQVPLKALRPQFGTLCN